VTIRLKESGNVFGEVVAGRVRLSAAGRIAKESWGGIPEHFPAVTLDAFAVMPDHVHGIVVIGDRQGRISQRGNDHDTGNDHNVGAQHAAPLHNRRAPHNRPTPSVPSSDTIGPAPGSLGAIIRAFKAATTKRLNEMRGTPGESIWQRNYYDRVIRDDRELRRARYYILLNPKRWTKAGKR